MTRFQRCLLWGLVLLMLTAYVASQDKPSVNAMEAFGECKAKCRKDWKRNGKMFVFCMVLCAKRAGIPDIIGYGRMTL
ncbi:hypothetical protein ScPMuIL_013889 [Solemya velum]